MSDARATVPVPKVPISVRDATIDDLPFIDALQKMHSNNVGWMPTKALVGKINAGHVLLAVGATPASPSEGEAGLAPTKERIGYCIGQDQYFKRDDVGIIYQMNVLPEHQRGLIGATLVKAMFDRAAYGCKLFCCWCAQDIEANHFWESLGFLPLAFRAGSRQNDRVHIFWQRRIREGDLTTPYWFPSQTASGSIREDRLVFPIPPNVKWSDEMPRVLPIDRTPKLEAPKKNSRKPKAAPAESTRGGLWFGQPKVTVEKPKRQKRPAVKNDPTLVAKARELRDRWLEKVNSDPSVLSSNGKYEVSKALLAPAARVATTPPLLEAA